MANLLVSVFADKNPFGKNPLRMSPSKKDTFWWYKTDSIHFLSKEIDKWQCNSKTDF